MFDIASDDLKSKYTEFKQQTKTLKFINNTRACSSIQVVQCTMYIRTQASRNMRDEKKETQQSNEIVKCKHFVGNILTTFPNALRRALL